jgi:hypothetical protein
MMKYCRQDELPADVEQQQVEREEHAHRARREHEQQRVVADRPLADIPPRAEHRERH